MNPISYGQTAVITGASGFVGSHLAHYLIKNGWMVHAIVRKTSNINYLRTSDQLRTHVHDGRTEHLINILKIFKPNIVFHLAAQSLAEHDSEQIETLIESNILFGTQLLEAMSKNGIKYFINTGSYWQHFETNKYNPVNLYAATKQAFEAIIQFYTECNGIHAVTLKLFDTYGPEDPRNRLFNLFDSAAKSGEVLNISPGAQKIDLVYIDDVVGAYVIAAQLILSGKKLDESYGVSSGRQISLKEVAKIYQKITKKNIKINFGGKSYRQREVMVPWKAKRLPGWKPLTDLETGIAKLIVEPNEAEPFQKIRKIAHVAS